MRKLLWQKLAQEAMVQSEFEDLWNEFQAFKKQMTGVCQKYDTNFRKVETMDTLNHCDLVAHETAIHLINKCCTCEKANNDESLDYATPVSSPSPVGMLQMINPTPLQVIPEFQIGNTIFPPFGEVNSVSFIVAASSGRNTSS